jgi:TRAP-type transport system small permease protein
MTERLAETLAPRPQPARNCYDACSRGKNLHMQAAEPTQPPAASAAPPANFAIAPLARIAGNIARTLLGLVLLAMVILNVVNAAGRYALGAVFIGSDELLVFAMIFMVMIGMLIVTAERGHIALDFLAHRLGPGPGLALCLLHDVIVLVASAYAAVQSFAFVARVGAMGQTSMALGLSMVVPHSALALGFAGTAVVSALLVMRDILALRAASRPSGSARR